MQVAVRSWFAVSLALLLLACAWPCAGEENFPPPLRLPDPDEVERQYNERRAAEKLREAEKNDPTRMDPSKQDPKKTKAGEQGPKTISHIADKRPDDDVPAEVKHDQIKKQIDQKIEEAKKAAIEKQQKAKQDTGAGASGNFSGSGDTKPKKGGLIVDGSSNGPTVDVRNMEKGHKKGDSIVIDPKAGQAESHEYTLGVKNPGKGPVIGAEGVVKYVPAGGPMSVSTEDGDAKSKLIKLVDPNKKRSFWDKLWGKKDEVPNLLGPTALKAGQVDTMDVNTSATDTVDATSNSLAKRLQAEMAAKRMAQESAVRAEHAAKEGKDTDMGKELPPATVVDLDREAKTAEKEKEDPKRPKNESKNEGKQPAPNPDRTPLTPLNEVAKGVPMQQELTEEEMKQAVELRFQKGLAAKDTVERDWAFRFATNAGRKEAVPAMLKETQDENVLAPMAILDISYLDPQNREAERLFIKELASKDGGIRQSCAVALGRMRSEEAAKPMAAMLKDEKNYRVRKAICEGLGGIGGNVSSETLRAVMNNKDELDEIRAQAALSLAGLGDRSGKERLINSLASTDPNQQLSGLFGLVQTGDPDTAGYLSAALESPNDGVWVMAAQYFPSIGPEESMKILRPKLQSNDAAIRRRAALALGMVGSDEGLPYIDEALRIGGLSERILAASLLGALKHKEKAPLLIEKLKDPQVAVRKTCAMSLAALGATEAQGALMDAARGARNRADLPPAMRAVPPDITEQLVMLDAIRILRGEKDILEFKTPPDMKNLRWPEYDKQLSSRQVDLLKTYKLLDVMSAKGKPVAAVLQDSNGKEILVRTGETVASGFKVSEMTPEIAENGKVKMPAMVSLLRGDTRVTLSVGRTAEVSSTKSR